MPSLHHFATWQPLLRLLHVAHAETLSAPGRHVAGQITPEAWSVPLPCRPPQPGRASKVSDNQDQFDAVGRIVDALKESGSNGASFVVEASSAPGGVRLYLISSGSSAEPGVATAHPGTLLLADGALPEPVRRLPDPVPGAVPAPSVDVGLLQRTLRERLPDAVGASEEEIAAAEARLGVPLPAELRALYQIVRGRYEDWDEYQEPYDTIGCELLPLDEVYVADAASRHVLWQFGAMEAVETGPEDAVQGLVGSPGTRSSPCTVGRSSPASRCWRERPHESPRRRRRPPSHGPPGHVEPVGRHPRSTGRLHRLPVPGHWADGPGPSRIKAAGCSDATPVMGRTSQRCERQRGLPCQPESSRSRRCARCVNERHRTNSATTRPKAASQRRTDGSAMS